MRNDVHRVNALLARKHVADLLQAVGIGAQLHHFDIGAVAALRQQAVDQLLRVGHRGIDEHDLAAALLLLLNIDDLRASRGVLSTAPTIAVALGSCPAHSSGFASAEYRMRGSSSSITGLRTALPRPAKGREQLG